MSISDAQLQTWSAQGKTGQFTDTYRSIRGNLLDSSAPYPVSDCEVFLQGSYGNDTNIFADSDVDVVLEHKGAFSYDLSRLSAPSQQAFGAAHSRATYTYTDFKADAAAWLGRLYNGVHQGTKAVFIPGNNSRRDADVLIAQQFRRYHDFQSLNNQNFDEGVCFYVGGTRIENFPKQHSANCTLKHQSTNSRFKPMVRIFKNMRNSMIDKGLLGEGLAPSYFLEGMLFNVPTEKFGGSLSDAFVECYNWIVNAERDKLVCANRLHWLVRDNNPTSWPTVNCSTFLTATKNFWES